MDIQAWDAHYSNEQNLEILKGIALAALQDLPEDNHHRVALTSLIERREFVGLVGYELTYSDGRYGPPLRTDVTSASEAIAVRQALACYQKNRSLDLGIDREAAAMEKFMDAERLCRRTNRVFDLWEDGRIQFPSFVEGVLHTTQRKISQILGHRPPLNSLRGRFGPGATIGLQKRWSSARAKLCGLMSCSEALAPYLPHLFRVDPLWAYANRSGEDGDSFSVTVSISDGTLSFVPKSAKIDRAIGVEPLLNTWGQLAVGDYIAGRLGLEGVDLRDQTRNQRLALQGSVSEDLATLDLSSASDTISIGLVRHLLPGDWFDLLTPLRTPFVKYKGQRIPLAKFSSMGNGYTFALETLIFYSLAWSTCVALGLPTSDVSSYGDDIIVPTGAYNALIGVLKCLGFVPNREKSFGDGPFRESCGKDYFRGIDVRPVYIKDVLRPCDLYVVHNYFVAQYSQLSNVVLGWVPKALRIWGPPGYGDGHLHSREWVGRQHNRDRGWAGAVFDSFSLNKRTDVKPKPGDWLYPAYTMYVRGDAPQESVSQVGPRGRWNTTVPGSRGYRKRSIYTLSYPAAG